MRFFGLWFAHCLLRTIGSSCTWNARRWRRVKRKCEMEAGEEKVCYLLGSWKQIAGAEKTRGAKTDLLRASTAGDIWDSYGICKQRSVEVASKLKLSTSVWWLLLGMVPHGIPARIVRHVVISPRTDGRLCTFTIAAWSVFRYIYRCWY